MGENRSLDDFFGGGDGDGGKSTAKDGAESTTEDEAEAKSVADATAADAAATDADAADGATADADATDGTGTDADEGIARPADVAPADVTYRWDPGGGACADCGATVERRWRDDGAFVCGDCKEW